MVYSVAIATELNDFRLLHNSIKNGNCNYFITDKLSPFSWSKHQLTQDDIENLHHWFLQDLILIDWFDVDGLSAEFSIDDLGNFTLEEADW